jgi:hypothetical protein
MKLSPTHPGPAGEVEEVEAEYRSITSLGGEMQKGRWRILGPFRNGGPIVMAFAAAAYLGTAVQANAQATTTAQATAAAPAGAVSDEGPTFYADVLPILRENCQECHRTEAPTIGGMLAPMALETYEQVRPWAPLIADAVERGKMPPWDAHIMHKGVFQGERYVMPRDQRILNEWASIGAPAGDPSQAPPPPAVLDQPVMGEDGWLIGTPDLVLEFPEPVIIPDEADDWQPNLLVEVPRDVHPEPRWIKQSEYQAEAHVHHAVSVHLGVGVPGRSTFTWPDGWGVLLPVDAVVTFNMHYYKDPGPGTEIADNTRGGFKFHEPGSVIDYVIQTEIPSYGRDLLIPAGDPNFEVSFERHFDEDVYLLAMGPHAHYRGKAFHYEVEYPDGARETLLWIPNYDFNWQLLYQYEEPKFLPAGSTLHGTWWFDNSADNPYNPDPTIDVRYGPETYWEMANARIYWASAEPRGIVVGDPIPQDVLDDANALAERGREEIRERGWMRTWEEERALQEEAAARRAND